MSNTYRGQECREPSGNFTLDTGHPFRCFDLYESPSSVAEY